MFVISILPSSSQLVLELHVTAAIEKTERKGADSKTVPRDV